MVNYMCPRCNYSSEKKSNMVLHLGRKNMCKFILFDVDISIYKDRILKKENLITELEFQEKIKKLEEENLKLKQNFNGNNNVINSNNNNTITNNITIVLPYDKPDISHLSEKEIMRIIEQKGLMAVNHLMEKIHFNPNKPENHNICIKNKKDNKISVYDGKYWKIYNDKDEILNKLISNNENILEDVAYKFDEVNNDFVNIKTKNKLEKYEEIKQKDGAIESLKLHIDNTIMKNREMVLDTHINKNRRKLVN